MVIVAVLYLHIASSCAPMNRSVKIAPSVSRGVGGRILLVSKTARIKWRNREYAYALLRNVKCDLYCKATKWALQRRGASEGRSAGNKVRDETLRAVRSLPDSFFEHKKLANASLEYRLSIINYRVSSKSTSYRYGWATDG